MNIFRFSRRHVILTGLAFCTAAGLISGLTWRPDLFQGIGNATAHADQHDLVTRALPVKVSYLGEWSAPDRLDTYRGTIEASKSANLSFRRSGRVININVREGDSVSQGQVLASLDSNDLQALLRGVESRINEAEAVLAEQLAGPRVQAIKALEAVLRERESAWELAKLNLAREENLQQSKASSQQAYDEARMGTARAAAAVQAAQEQLDELVAGTRSEQIDAQRARIESLHAQREDLQVQLNDCQLIAPFAGVVARRFVDEGIIAGPEREVLKILQIDPLEARFGVAADDAAKLKPGATVNLAKGNLVFPATVARIEPELDQATRTQAVTIAIATSELIDEPAFQSALVPGQTVSLALIDSRTNQDEFWIPIQALSRSIRGLWSVMSVEQQNGQWIVSRHDVQVVEVDGNFARIRSTILRSGHPIIAEGLHRVSPGMVVDF